MPLPKLPDAVAKILARHYGFRVNGLVEEKQGQAPNGLLNGRVENGEKKTEAEEKGVVVLQQLTLGPSVQAEEMAGTHLFDICPECGAGSLAYEEGCRKCYSCGYAEC
ncbi:MAG: hypothetical protein HYS68_03035 [Candidatus Levybacteria bacterium]|nr:hypothetical protein [Candidatus Levybacteria bacterium]